MESAKVPKVNAAGRRKFRGIWNFFWCGAFIPFDQAYELGMTQHKTNKEGPPPGVAPSIDAVSRRLREYYDAVKDEAIPDRFLDLLQKLDEADQARETRTDGGEQRS